MTPVATTPYRIMIVDDSAVIRGMLARILESESGFRVVASVPDGQQALDALKRTDPDVILLDIEMPVMDGLEALPQIKKARPHVQVIMVSTLTQRNADISLRALALGAADYLPKPTSSRDIMGEGVFKRELLEKLQTLAEVARRSESGINRPSASTSTATVPQHKDGSSSSSVVTKKEIVLRRGYVEVPKILAIGSSTGGPQALFRVIRDMGVNLPQPIVIVQHMPPTFTTILAEHISRQCGVTCTEIQDGTTLVSGNYYVAAGDFHTILRKNSTSISAHLTQDPPENFCCPAFDPLLRSLIPIYGSKILALVLTGMGHDGLRGCEEVVKAGGAVVAQDEATSIVWGMPGSVAMAGLCSTVLPLDKIGAHIRELAMRAG